MAAKERNLSKGFQVISHFLFLFLALYGREASAKDITVVDFQLDGTFTSTSHLIAHQPLLEDDVEDLTMCFWLSLAHLRGTYNYFVSYADARTDNALTAQLLYKREVIELEICKYRATQECSRFALEDFEFFKWMHFCTTFEVSKSGDEVTTDMKTWKNGELVHEASVTNSKDNFNGLKSGGTMALGQDQDMVGGNFDASQALSGKMAGFGLWDEVLSESKIKKQSSCSDVAEGNLFGWGDVISTYNTSNVGVHTEPLDSLCMEDPLKDKFIISERTTYEGFKSYCNKLNGFLPVVTDMDSLKEIHDKMAAAFLLLPPKEKDVCSVSNTDETFQFYLGQRMNESQVWIDPYKDEALVEDNQVQQYVPFESSDECLYAWGRDSFEAMACNSKFACGVCLMPTTQKLKLKGLCKESVEIEFEYDIDYYIYGQMNGKPHFRGIMNSHIYFDLEHNFWRLQSLRNPAKFLLMNNKNPNILPIGTHMWKLGIDAALCLGNKGEEVELTMSSCFYNKYSCDSGDCIPLAKRCNTEIDCQDKSDEYECDYLSFGSNYAKELIPRDEKGEAVIVYMNVSVLAFPFIETMNLKFTADFFLSLRWYDLRIDFKDLNNVTFLNSLNGDDRESIWVPRLGFVNALGPYQTTVDDLTTGVLLREDDPLPEDFSFSTEAMLFSGETNSINLRREYYQEYACEFDLLFYPFDTQMCKMVFQVQGKTDKYVKLMKDYEGIEFLGGRQLVEYQIQLEAFETLSIGNISTAIVKIVFRRRMEYHVTNTFLQTLILVGIGFMSYQFDEHNFSDRIMVVLTTMLVIATIMSSTQQSLPKTSYYKLIDWWLLVCLNILVITMSFHTYIAKVCEHPDRHKKKQEGMMAAVMNRLRTSKGPRTRVGTAKTREVAGGRKKGEKAGRNSNAGEVNRTASLIVLGPGSAAERYLEAEAEIRLGKEVQTARAEDTANTAANANANGLVGNRGGNLYNNYDDSDDEEIGGDKDRKKGCCHRWFYDPVFINNVGKVVYIAILVGFNTIFWIVALQEYLRDAEQYINKDHE